MTRRLAWTILPLWLGSIGCNGIADATDPVTSAMETEEKVDVAKFAKPGFKVFEADGRLWVFREGSEGLAQYEQTGEPAKSVTVIGGGPNGMTIRSDDRAVIDAYMAP